MLTGICGVLIKRPVTKLSILRLRSCKKVCVMSQQSERLRCFVLVVFVSMDQLITTFHKMI